MLLFFTSLVNFAGTEVSLWLAFYLLGRGFPSRITLRAVIVLLAISFFFFSAYTNLYLPIPGSVQIEAIFLTVGLSIWCDLGSKIFLSQPSRRLDWLIKANYGLALITIFLLLGARDSHEGGGQGLWLQGFDFSLPSIVFGIFILMAGITNFYNMLSGAKLRASLQNRYFLITTILVFNLVGWGILVLIFNPPAPRLIQDIVVLVSILLLGISVARHQSLVERRANLQDFVIAALAAFGLASIYAGGVWIWSRSPILTFLVSTLAVFTHATYDLVREFLDSLRRKNENDFRSQLRRMGDHAQGETSMRGRLQEGIKLLCRILNASGGFIAIRQENIFVAAAAFHSVPVGHIFPLSDLDCAELCQPSGELAKKTAWLAPAFARDVQVAVIGLGPSRKRFHFSEDDLDLLAEAADQVGVMVYLQQLRPHDADPPPQKVSALRTPDQNVHAESDELIATLVTNPDPAFVHMVEDGLRNLSDYVTLGQYPLTKSLGVPGGTNIERGKAVRQRLIHAVEMLRPDKIRPVEPIPREWHSYVVLHDAYIEQVPNRDIMARLYISEGTFNRTRRKALRGVARFLLEKEKA